MRVAGTDRSVGLRRDRDAARRVFRRRAGRRTSSPASRPTGYFQGGELAFANGSNACEVEVDSATGDVKILRYVVAHDCGRLINPLLVDGQIRGGVVHGIGNALHEHMVFDERGAAGDDQLRRLSAADRDRMPPIEVIHLETPSPLNPIGVKGAGEGGTIPATACVISAIEDALAPFGVTHQRAPGVAAALGGADREGQEVRRCAPSPPS